MKRPQIFPLFVLALMTVSLVGCGGGSTPTPPPVVISVSFGSTPPTSLVTSATTSLSAVVSNDSSGAGVKWTATCTAAASSTCGSFSSAATASGAATTYTAPSAVPNPATVTITATSAADSTKSVSAPITITLPVISVAFAAAPPTALAASTSTSITANVANDSANAGVKWTVACTTTAPATCGSFSATSTASGTATTYTAPSVIPNPATVTVTATSVTDPTKSASATITITAPGIVVTFAAAPPSSLSTSSTTSITANVANDSANAGVKWTVTCTTTAPATCGSFSAATTASGTATTYTAPGVIPNPATVTVTATSVTDSTKSVSATITIGAILANGNYVYHISGEDATGPYFIAGAIVVQNGLITAGEQDFSDRSNGYTTVFPATGSSISVVGSNVQLTLNTGNTNIGVSGIETLRGPKVSSTRVLLSEFDTFASGSGSLDLQTGTAAPSGGYVFSVGGIDGTTNGYALGMGGVLNISGTTISPTGSVIDVNDGGLVTQSISLSSGTVSTVDSVGRVTFTVTPNSTALAAFVLTGYIVGTNRIQLVESQMDTLNADLGGTALGQGSHTGTFTPTGVANSTYVFVSPGTDSTGMFGSTLTFAGSLTLGNASALSGTIALNDMTYYGAVTITGGTYAVDPTGRVTISGITPTLQSNPPFAIQLYLDGNGNAMELGDDSNTLSYGMAYQQSNATTAPSGNFGMTGAGFGNVNNTAPGWSASGPVTVASSGAVTGYTDYNLAGTTPTSNVALTGTVTSSSTTISLAGINAASASTANAYYYFSIDAKRFLALENDGAQLGILQLETISP
jgi:hypothetical protein